MKTKFVANLASETKKIYPQLINTENIRKLEPAYVKRKLFAKIDTYLS
jgi:hypothetical protein